MVVSIGILIAGSGGRSGRRRRGRRLYSCLSGGRRRVVGEWRLNHNPLDDSTEQLDLLRLLHVDGMPVRSCACVPCVRACGALRTQESCVTT